MTANAKQHRALLQDIAHRAIRERGLLPDFSVVLGIIKKRLVSEAI